MESIVVVAKVVDAARESEIVGNWGLFYLITTSVISIIGALAPPIPAGNKVILLLAYGFNVLVMSFGVTFGVAFLKALDSEMPILHVIFLWISVLFSFYLPHIIQKMDNGFDPVVTSHCYLMGVVLLLGGC